jgi:hypothetical protein
MLLVKSLAKINNNISVSIIMECIDNKVYYIKD